MGYNLEPQPRTDEPACLAGQQSLSLPEITPQRELRHKLPLPVLINKVSLEVTVEAVIGGFVVLPCSSTKHHLKPQDIEVFWRHNDSKIVFDIIKGKHSETQDPQYKNRVEPFTNLRRNYSIKLTDLTQADAGKYICYITPSNEQETVQMIIKESTAETGNKSSDQENQGEDSGADNVGKSGPLLWDINVHWRQNGSKIVYDIVEGKDSIAEQNQRYKNRAETFPEEYEGGNFSLKITSLTHADAGKYNCLITPSDEQKTVELIIKENEREKTDNEWLSLYWVYIAVLLIVLLIACFITYLCCRKKR
ncbi:hypothetical protein G5714_021871 [Onychostoma macrolepis]|uniref:Ig-like domain-containing protein n=1 Tax=Onychostoma macrolepis TaxID=369639 RepID=A0A7J6BTM3_9TELE|nr:hypothetical protein G5714_021871 [Onychostoma macrolepis]